MQNNEFFYPSSSLEMLMYLINKKNFICGIYHCNKLVGFSTVCYIKNNNKYFIEDTLVHDKYRGKGFQKKMWLHIINFLPSSCDIFCTIHPQNIYSLQNALSVGFKIVSRKKLYNSYRYILKYHKII